MMVTMDPIDASSTFSRSSTLSEDTEDKSMSGSVGRSHRYKVAMTARARQRRMRRMKDKERSRHHEQEDTYPEPAELTIQVDTQNSETEPKVDELESGASQNDPVALVEHAELAQDRVELRKERNTPRDPSAPKSRPESSDPSPAKNRPEPRDLSAPKSRSGSRNRPAPKSRPEPRDPSAPKNRPASRNRSASRNRPEPRDRTAPKKRSERKEKSLSKNQTEREMGNRLASKNRTENRDPSAPKGRAESRNRSASKNQSATRGRSPSNRKAATRDLPASKNQPEKINVSASKSQPDKNILASKSQPEKNTSITEYQSETKNILTSATQQGTKNTLTSMNRPGAKNASASKNRPETKNTSTSMDRPETKNTLTFMDRPEANEISTSMNLPEPYAQLAPKDQSRPQNSAADLTQPVPRNLCTQTIRNEPITTPQKTNRTCHSLKKETISYQHPVKEDFLPKLNEGLSPDQIRDAVNFTSVGFQCSNKSGEIEVLSGDDCAMENRGDTTQSSGYFRNDVWSEASTPSILNKGEIFHQKAAASIVSLLTPETMSKAGLMAPEGVEDEKDCSPDVTVDSPTGVASPGLTFDTNDPGLSRGGEWKGTEQVRKNLFPAEKSKKPLDIFQELKKRMIQPSKQLSELLQQISRSPDTDIDRTFSNRRKNACGAIKILSAKECNRLKICWTIGVLPAISSVLSDVDEDLPDDVTKMANTEARNRIVATLLNLSVNKKNRMLICNTPGVLQSMAKVIMSDEGESRQGCCTAILYLAKTAETRVTIAKDPELLKALAKVIRVPPIKVAVKAPVSSGVVWGQNRYLKEFAEDPQTSPGNSCKSPLSSPKSPADSTMASNTSFDNSETSDMTSCNSSDESSQGSSSQGSATLDTASRISTVEEPKLMEIKFQNTPVNSPGAKSTSSSVGWSPEPTTASEEDYDADPNLFLHGARLSTFAALLCLVKNKDNSLVIARNEVMIDALIGVSNKHSSPSHARAVSVLAHLTRHPKNCHHLVFKFSSLLTTLQATTCSQDSEARKYALCALQNLSMDKSCRTQIAHTPKIIFSLTERIKAAENNDEVLASVAALQNLSDEPANLIQFTIVNNCVASIIEVAEGKQKEKSKLTEFLAKNTLATLSHWFRKIATSGSERISRSPHGFSGTSHHPYNAVLQPTEYNQWA